MRPTLATLRLLASPLSVLPSPPPPHLPAAAGADAELALVAYFQSQANEPAVSMASIHANKLNALVAGSVLDLVG